MYSKLQHPEAFFFLKQALKEVKKHTEIGPELRAVSPQRIKYENNFISRIKNRLPERVQIPHIYFYDEENNILLMSDVAGATGKLHEQALLNGDFNAATAARVGQFLGRIHRRTYGKGYVIRQSRAADRDNWRRFLRMRTINVRSRSIEPEVLDELSRFYDTVLQHHTREVLICIDCCPKNIVEKPDGRIGVFDFELATGVGDPAYDLGFLIGHYLIHALLARNPDSCLQAVENAVCAYDKELQGSQLNQQLLLRMPKYAGATMLYRVAGASRLSFIIEDKRDEILRKGSELILKRCNGDADRIVMQIRESITESLR
jgi:thiamine kinase-like enzyme